MSNEEWKVLGVFGVTALLWIVYPFFLKGIIPGIGDTMVALFGAVLLFLISSSKGNGQLLLDEKTFSNIPWGVLLLFGAGFSVAGVFQTTGVAAWLSGFLAAFYGVNYFFIVLAVSALRSPPIRQSRRSSCPSWPALQLR